MSPLGRAAAGAPQPVRLTHAIAGTVLTALLSVLFALTVIVGMANGSDTTVRMTAATAAEVAAPTAERLRHAGRPVGYAAGAATAEASSATF